MFDPAHHKCLTLLIMPGRRFLFAGHTQLPRAVAQSGDQVKCVFAYLCICVSVYLCISFCKHTNTQLPLSVAQPGDQVKGHQGENGFGLT